MRTQTQRLRLVLAIGALTLVLVGCTESDVTEPLTTPSSAEASSAAPAPVAYLAGGTAEQNLPVFDRTLRDVAEADPQVAGSAVVDALVAAGFPRDSMQRTADETSVGLDADSVQVAVKLGDSCLVGQYGPRSGGVRAVVAAPIATGACLIGRTVPVDG
ncbi:DUF6993 domain-containing protein [Rathayibacter tanaceti]|uniref:DUF6993 domain-containing protein n=2 Tax=Rathayibacter tanaceti TaxID=1671680 RepID=A0A162GKG3_9MICO|nr:hypothetical protein [Rathayibacter tanaceti]KZX22689.1 hypothetical protein ACH61_00178 [Rathayibacter tanaceti]QHC55583.1 hypothetical protein GSU10_07995 [Rathayibacter tanaceti]TCO39630.1 hypothetical protein EV639_101582 [Rathayibacter tanaceti]